MQPVAPNMHFGFLQPLPRLYFAHTPKTAGLALGTVLRDAYGRHARFPAYARRHLASYTESQIACYRLFSGHWGIGFMALLPAGTELITVLRDPVEQTMSWWHHMRRTILQYPAWYAQERARWQPLLDQDLSGSLASPFLVGLMTNMQCKHLGVHFDLRPWTGIGESNAGALQSQFHSAFASADDVAAYHQARQTLRQVSVLGITEQFGATLAALCCFLGVPKPRREPQNNLNPQKSAPITSYYRSRLDASALRQLEEMTRYDRMLYEEGLGFFAAQQLSLNARYAGRIRLLPTARSMLYRSARRAWRHARHTAPWLDHLRR